VHNGTSPKRLAKCFRPSLFPCARDGHE